MADKNKRTSIFTVQDAESAMTWLTIIVLGGLIYAYVHEITQGQDGFRAIYAATDYIPKIMSIATVVIILKEGGDIMFRRLREAIREDALAKEQARAEGRAEVQQQWQEWYQRQVEAQQKGQPFTEPPPNLNGDTSEES